MKSESGITTLLLTLGIFLSVNIYSIAGSDNYFERFNIKASKVNLNLDSIASFYKNNYHSAASVESDSLIINSQYDCLNSIYTIKYWSDNLYIYSKITAQKNVVPGKDYLVNTIEFQLYYEQPYVHRPSILYVDFKDIDDYYYSIKVQDSLYKSHEKELNSFVSNYFPPKNTEYALAIHTNSNVMTSAYTASVLTPYNKLCEKCEVITKIKTTEIKTLASELFSINTISSPSYSSDCEFNPHDAIVFYDKNNKMISILEICFECDEMIYTQLPRPANTSTYKTGKLFTLQDSNRWLHNGLTGITNSVLLYMKTESSLQETNRDLEYLKNKNNEHKLQIVK